jgi:hypothetical protein
VSGVGGDLSLHHLDGLPALALVLGLADAGDHTQAPKEKKKRRE